LAVFCAGALLICPSVANDESLNAKAVPGQRYDGKTGTGNRIFLRATGGGERLATYRFVVRTRCSDGRGGYGLLNHDGEGPAEIARDGTFAYATSRESSYRLRGGKRLAGRSAFELRGRFAPGGRSVTGTLRSGFRSPSLTCSSGAVPFKAYLDGAKQAPFTSRNVASGAYSALPERLSRFRFRVLLPARQVSVSFRWRERCGGRMLSGRESFPSIFLRGRKFVFETSHPAPGGRGTERASLALRFARESSYVVYGTFSARLRRCTIGPESFVGVISPGDSPLNLDRDGPLGAP
jgi:hypothetical protein